MFYNERILLGSSDDVTPPARPCSVVRSARCQARDSGCYAKDPLFRVVHRNASLDFRINGKNCLKKHDSFQRTRYILLYHTNSEYIYVTSQTFTLSFVTFVKRQLDSRSSVNIFVVVLSKK